MRRFSALVAACWMWGGAAAAYADDSVAPEVQFRTVWTAGERAADTPPRIQATLTNLGSNAPAMLALEVDGKPAGVGSADALAGRTEPAAIAIVFEGNEPWFARFRPMDEWTSHDGGGDGVRDMLDDYLHHFELGDGSQVAVIDYDVGAHVRVPLSPVARVGSEAAGSDADHVRLGTDLVQGVDLGLAQLARSRAPHKLLIVIGDGQDTNNQAARLELAASRRAAQEAGIAVAAVVYEAEPTHLDKVILVLDPHAQIAGEPGAIGPAVAAILTRFTDRVTVTFPGSAVAWDGAPHVLTINHPGGDAESLAAARYVLAKWIRPPRSWWREPAGYLVQIAAGILFAALFLAGLAMRTRWVAGARLR